LKSDPTTYVDVRCDWGGSIDGIVSLIYASSNTFQHTLYPNELSSLTASGTNWPSSYAKITAPADLAFSDAFQSSTRFKAVPGKIDALIDTVVGVVPFVWVKNAGAPASISNMTSLAAQKLLGATVVPLSFFSGDFVNDSGTYVMMAGRNPDSGTRLTAFAETGYGIETPPAQVKVLYNSTDVTNVVLYPVDSSVKGYPTLAEGESGESSGSTLATSMTKANSNNGAVNLGITGWIVSYMSIGDANTAGLGGWLTYNGVPYTADNVRNGKYTFWGYEHFLRRSDASAAAVSFYNTLGTSMQANTSSGTTPTFIQESTMNVARDAEGTPVGSK
jgi:hypothetical protein